MHKVLTGLILFWGTLQANDYWGHHLILDCKSCEIASITSRETLTEFVKTLVDEIDMKAYGEPLLEHFATHEPEAAGYTLVQLIETSAITGHFVDKNGDAYIDIFSCKEFDPNLAMKIVERFLNPEKITPRFFKRQA